jgi:hypothetical protein
MHKLDLEPEGLSRDLVKAGRFHYSEPYNEFVCGRWQTCTLWNSSGDSGDSRIADYDGTAVITEYGERLSYISQLIVDIFRLERLRFARLAKLSPGTVLVPHRDYLELSAELTRIHIPLQTDGRCYTSQENCVFVMQMGEIWFLDATRVHSIASFSDIDRVHLILDFAKNPPPSLLKLKPQASAEIPADSVVSRVASEEAAVNAIRALARIIDSANFMDIVAIIVKKFFTAGLACESIFALLDEIACASGDGDVIAKAVWIREHALTRR